MPLPAAEHARVQREQKDARNAPARRRRLTCKDAEAWCATMEADVQRWDHFGALRYTVRVPGFHAGDGAHPGAVRGGAGRHHRLVVPERGPAGAHRGQPGPLPGPAGGQSNGG